ncbi:MAG: hypothetical protein CMA64_07115 [Euryarchaeota archaeon]|nr:hypothetical protein [Euryarchaeota archaeon]
MNVKFICSDKHVLKNFPIVPAKKCLPEWYSKLKANEPNISKCMPVRDIITAGYIIPNAYEQGVGVSMDNGIEMPEVVYPVEKAGEFYTFLNHIVNPDFFHTHDQCPVDIHGSKKGYYKIKLPWRIETPKGYSTLLMQPFYQFNTDLVIMPSIVDTDEYDHSNVNFPCYIRKSEVDIKPGQPLVQCIPFKRDEWTHSLSFEKESTSSKMNLFLNNMYKRAFHQKKNFK